MGSLHTSPTSPPPLPHLNRLLEMMNGKPSSGVHKFQPHQSICCVFTAIHPVSNGSVSRASTLDKALATKKKVCCMCICSYQHNLCVIVPLQGKLCEPASTPFACCCRLSLTPCLLLRQDPVSVFKAHVFLFYVLGY